MLLLGESDIDGYFELSVPQKSNTLIFGFIGYEFATISFPDTCEYIEVVLEPDVLYHYKSSRKIDKLREKEFDKLSDIHSKAIDKGFFVMGEPCFYREFQPIKPRLDQIREQLRAKRKANKRYFKDLAVGDTIRIPYSGSYGSDGTDRTNLIPYSYVVGGNQFDCIIEGVIVDKSKSYNGYNFMYEVIDIEQCKYDSIIHEERDMKKGEVFRYNMKYFKVIKE